MSEPPRLPARRGRAIPFFSEPSLQGTSLSWSRAPGRHCHSLVVKATATIGPDGTVSLDQEAGPLRGDEPEGRDAMGPVTYASDGVPVKANADVLVWAVAERSEVEAEVTFEFAGLKRRLGLRGLEGRPVGQLPLSWSAAPFDLERNPAGCPPERARITGEGAAGWAPVRLHWPCRQQHFGTYDAHWMQTRFPHYAEDFNPLALQSAPDGQQVGALRGDEAFRFEGVKGARHVLEGQLPGIRPRAYAMRPGTEMVPIELRLDTVAFDLEAMQIDLVWRGIFDVADRRATDVAAWFATLHDALDDTARREAFWALHGPVAEPEAKETERARTRESSEVDEVDEVDEVEAALRARDRLAAAGVSPTLLANTDEIRRAASGPLFPEELDVPPPRPEPRQWPSADADPQRRAVVAWLAGEAEAPRRLVGAELSELDFSGRDLSSWSLRGCHLAGCRFDACDLTEAELGDADATGASFVGAKLVRADLQGARLAGVDARRASMADASLHGADGSHACFDEAQAPGATFTGGVWKAARFAGADLRSASFEGSNLEGAVLTGANMKEARLYDAYGEGVSFATADLTGLRADGAKLPSARFEKARAAEAIFDGADLRQSQWNGAIMPGVSLVECSLEGADLAEVSARDARLTEADLSSCDLRGSDWMASDLSHAILRDADVRRASLFGADLFGAATDGLQTEGANLTRTLLKPT